ncbi:MAG: hypothetical protein ABI178_15885, partial [Rhodanobacter sp.]
MNKTWTVCAVLGGSLCLSVLPASAQTDLPGITVTAPYTTAHGGYLISGDFKVDRRMPSVVFPAQPLVKDDILSIQPIRLADDEYLVLQECATASCSQAAIVRVWNTDGATTMVQNSDDRIWVRHENKYFIWLKRLPWIGMHSSCPSCPSHFTTFEGISPPLTLVPDGELAAYHQQELATAYLEDPVPVVSEKHERSTLVVTYAGGSTVRIKRMHA